jgi:hypothetical protein
MHENDRKTPSISAASPTNDRLFDASKDAATHPSESDECCCSLGQTPAAHIVEQTDAYDMATVKTTATIQAPVTFGPVT